jgi:hypothetical protein
VLKLIQKLAAQAFYCRKTHQYKSSLLLISTSLHNVDSSNERDRAMNKLSTPDFSTSIFQEELCGISGCNGSQLTGLHVSKGSPS